jgi:hypothetical protein
MKPDFIGVGAQKAGTSWVYACLYEHPEICAPYKEIHFFSREKNWSKGKEWYEHYFRNCDESSVKGEFSTVKGEFSTSYLYDAHSAERIKNMYPETKILVSLRNPVERAYSQYRNAIKMVEIEKDTSFEQFLEREESVVGQGMYFEQVKRFIDVFGKKNVLVLIHEDAKCDPKKYIQSIYSFLGVDDAFVPTMLERKVNVARTPRSPHIDRIMMKVSGVLRRSGLEKVVWFVKKSGIADLVRKLNTDTQTDTLQKTRSGDGILEGVFTDDVDKLCALIGRDLHKDWKI